MITQIPFHEVVFETEEARKEARHRALEEEDPDWFQHFLALEDRRVFYTTAGEGPSACMIIGLKVDLLRSEGAKIWAYYLGIGGSPNLLRTDVLHQRAEVIKSEVVHSALCAQPWLIHPNRGRLILKVPDSVSFKAYLCVEEKRV